MAQKIGMYSTTTRRIKLFDYLRGKRLATPLSELMTEFGVSDDTIRRDLVFIADAGYAVDFGRDENHEGRTVVSMRSPSFIDVPITREEAHTFAGSRRLWEPLKGTPFYDNFENLYRKVVESLPPKERAEIERDRARFFCIPDGGVLRYEKKREVIDALRLGAMSRRRVKYEYRTRAGEHRSGVLEPFAIGVYRNTIYVLARLLPSRRALAAGEKQRLEWVSWPAHRFVTATVTRHEFTVPPDFTLDDHFDGWGIISGEKRERVVVEFDAQVAPLIAERFWHKSQILEPLADGGVRLTWDVASTSELFGWILGYGSHATVIEPATLRMEIFREFTKGLERMFARIPSGPDPPIGWRDEGLRLTEPVELNEIRSSASNENAPRGRESTGGADGGGAGDDDGADDDDGCGDVAGPPTADGFAPRLVAMTGATFAARVVRLR